MTDAELIRWAINEVRDLDELARSMIPGYESLDSEDMGKLQSLVTLADSLEIDNAQD